MGGFSSVMTGLSMVGNLIGGVSDNNAQYRAMQAQQNANYAFAQQQAAHQRAEMELKARSDEETRQAALKRAVARQRTAYGATGLSGVDGSGRAVLLGLFEESEDEKRRREELDRLRYSAIDSELAHKRTVNMLDLSAKRDRNNIATITGLAKTAGGIGGLMG